MPYIFRKKLILWVVALLLLVFPKTSHAYFDPGTGSIILQALAAGFISIAIFWRSIIDKIRHFFSKKKDKE